MGNTKAEKLINWIEVSRLMAGNDTSISKNRCPKMYTKRVESLMELINTWISNDKMEALIEATEEMDLPQDEFGID